jgi:hypothetical protein
MVRLFLLFVILGLWACEAKKPAANPHILSLTIEWVIPDQRENGTPLRPEDIKGYNVHYRRCGAQDWTPGWRPGGDSATMEFDLPRACYEFRVNAEDAEGLTSPWSPLTRTE